MDCHPSLPPEGLKFPVSLKRDWTWIRWAFSITGSTLVFHYKDVQVILNQHFNKELIMKVKIFNPITISIFVLMCSFFLLNLSTPAAQQCQIIRIATETADDHSRIWLYPSEATVAKGNCVIWMSLVEGEKVSITFQKDAKTCIEATGFPTGFKVAEDCYFTDFMSYGQTVSLHFKEPGTFTYQLEIPGEKKGAGWGYHGKIIREGTIVVK
jgi:hypothetical protein